MFGVLKIGKLGASMKRAGFNPRTLFAASEPGAWYDPSDMSTLFQDAAGTVPVTAVEQLVGLILDKSGRGNHATQATTPKRPIYSRRVNLLTKTEQFSDAVWSKFTNGTGAAPVVTDAFGTAPDGTQTATRFQLSVGAGTTSGDVSYVTQAVTNAAQSLGRIWVKLNSGANKNFTLRVGGTISHSNLATSEWQEFSISDATGNRLDVLLYGHQSGGSIDMLVWHPSITLATDAHLPYQRVTDSTDYDADPAKFPAYLRFDGVDDALQTGNIDFTGTDKMTVWAGVTALDMGRTSGAANQLLDSNGENFNGFGMRTPYNPGAIDFYSSGPAGYADPNEGSLGAAPRSMVICGVGDQSAPLSQIRRDGVLRASRTTVQGASGGYGNRSMWMGSHSGISGFFNGRLYSLIVRGAQSSLSQIEATEVHIKQKMRLP